MMALGKILKKHDKNSQWAVSSVYLKAAEEAYFHSSSKVSVMMAAVESQYSRIFAGHDRHKAMDTLRPRRQRAPHTITFFLGMCVGGALALLASGAVMLTVAQRAGGPTFMESVFPVFSGVFLIILHLYMYGINVLCWKYARINYGFIFEADPCTILGHRQVLLIASALLVLFLGAVVGQLAANTRTIASEVIPLVAVAAPLLLLFLPLNMFYRSSRFFFLRTLRHIILAPLYKVHLPDFFLADQLTSQVPLLRVVEYMACYYMGGFFLQRDYKACQKNPHFVRFSYIVALLPFWFRLMQCLRRFADERHSVHIANGAKYLSAMSAVALRLLHTEHRNSLALLGLSIIFSTAAAVYGCWWDLVRDWGLLNRSSRNPWLRNRLALSRKWVYFVSMALNTVLRFAWLQSVTPFQFGPLLTFMFAGLEVIRRGQWNFYRLENEHLNNVGNFRAVRQVPLPFVELDHDDDP